MTILFEAVIKKAQEGDKKILRVVTKVADGQNGAPDRT